jgi:hypothetical protein
MVNQRIRPTLSARTKHAPYRQVRFSRLLKARPESPAAQTALAMHHTTMQGLASWELLRCAAPPRVRPSERSWSNAVFFSSGLFLSRTKKCYSRWFHLEALGQSCHPVLCSLFFTKRPTKTLESTILWRHSTMRRTSGKIRASVDRSQHILGMTSSVLSRQDITDLDNTGSDLIDPNRR